MNKVNRQFKTKAQIDQLKKYYDHCFGVYPGAKIASRISEEIGLDKVKIRKWFWEEKKRRANITSSELERNHAAEAE